jgi:hypothetical protein
MLSAIVDNYREICFRIIQWDAIAARPLSLSELGGVLSIKGSNGLVAVRKVEGYLHYCGGLLDVTNRNDWNNAQTKQRDVE